MWGVQTSPRAARKYLAQHGFEPWEASGLVSLRTAQQTKRLVGVYDAKLAGIEEDGGWATVCEEHATCVVHDTRELAMWHASDPKGWCEACRGHECNDLCLKYEHCPSCLAHVGPEGLHDRCPSCDEEI